MKKQLLKNWEIAYAENSFVVKNRFSPVSVNEIEMSGIDRIPASVPGNFELDLMKQGLLPDIYTGDNILKARKYEGTHIWYYTEFEIKGDDCPKCLCFDGIDTVAEIFIDGRHMLSAENMFIEYKIPLDSLICGRHEVLVHITPACVAERVYELPPMCRSLRYQRGGLSLRKAAYMYGWDIMPRLVSAGLWRDAYIETYASSRIADIFIYTSQVNSDNAELRAYVSVKSDCDVLSELTVKIEGSCGDSAFLKQSCMFSSSEILVIPVEKARLWWPKNYGEPDLYDVKVTLLHDGEPVDERTLKVGIRTVRLDRTSSAGQDGKFDFYINGRRIFIMGTNLVPTDAFPSRCRDYELRQLELANDLGCNMVRVWGGGVYPESTLYDYCDEHGILVWQDFAMACAVYPDEPRMRRLISAEAKEIVKRYRSHASLCIWAGDNECDEMYLLNRIKTNGRTERVSDPNSNVLTREIIRHIVDTYDGTRPYLPSSPYRDPDAVSTGRPAEDHLWGPRDFFKGDFYKNSVAHFASETGYHGCPSPASLARFITPEHIGKRGDGKVCRDPQWLLHAANAEPEAHAPYAYRIPLMIRQVERLFGNSDGNIAEFALKSQISQAEAVKYFIEKFRAEKGCRSGILWWNVIDGWPQISDAVVDWYGVKKLAYHYIKRSQQPFCILAAEPGNGMSGIMASNCTMEDVTVGYRIQNVLSGEVIFEGEASVAADSGKVLECLPDRKGYYVIRWQGDSEGFNTYVSKASDGWDFSEYKRFMHILGIERELSGF